MAENQNSMKQLYIIIVSALLISCARASEPKVLDAQHHSLFFAGIELCDGLPAVNKVLAEHGIHPKGTPNKVDLSLINDNIYYYQDYDIKSLTPELCDLLTYQLLPSDGVTGGTITVCYLHNKTIKEVQVILYPETKYSDELSLSICKRLSELFPNRKSEPLGGTTFSDDSGNFIYFSGKSEIVVHVE